ncbi:MAG: hypothetical protein ABS43_01715 [Bordetella sp. SCN 67-23]|nr:MAG: hypothetical protein ABS43_01715 [Bordetella sp. SCN 67-23]OJW90092.1 MAG: hypothetical protein BGO71_27650 [Burkholderiales bacterium 67-32]
MSEGCLEADEMDLRRPRGRPRGEISETIIELVSERPMAVRELAARMAVPVRRVEVTCSRLVAAGHIAPVRKERMQGARRPLAVYGPARLTDAIALLRFTSLAGLWR